MSKYIHEMIEDIKDYIKENISADDFSDREELEEKLNDELFNKDCITGNASGSYYFNSYAAQEKVLDNMDELENALQEFGYDNAAIGEMFINQDWEKMDVIIRCYKLGEAISAALDEMEEAEEITYSEEK